jgi:hypothetical protein
MRRSLKGLYIVWGDTHILKAQALEGFEAKNVSDNTGGQVRDRSFFKEV